MSFEKSDRTEILHQTLLKLSLVSNITLLRQEFALMWQVKDTINTEDMKNFIDNMAHRRDYLLDMAAQILDSDDLKQFKDLLEDSLARYFKEFDLKTMKWEEKTI